MKTTCLILLTIIWAVRGLGTGYAVPATAGFSSRVGNGGASQAARRANDWSCSPRIRALNDSAERPTGGNASGERRSHGRTLEAIHPPRRTTLPKASLPRQLPNSRQRSITGNGRNLRPPGLNTSSGTRNGGLMPNQNVPRALPIRMSSAARPTVPSFNNVRHRAPNPAVVGGAPNIHSSNTGAINGTRMNRKP
jgi:hypothetical protein